jgi:hypothetical protein
MQGARYVDHTFSVTLLPALCLTAASPRSSIIDALRINR